MESAVLYRTLGPIVVMAECTYSPMEPSSNQLSEKLICLLRSLLD